MNLCGIWASLTGLKICSVILPWKLLSFLLWLDVLAPILMEEASCKCSCRWMNLWYWWASPEGHTGRLAGQWSKVWRGLWKYQSIGRKAVATDFCRYSRQTGPTLPKFMGRFMRASVFVLYLTFPQIALQLFLLVLFQLLLRGFSGSQVLQDSLESLVNWLQSWKGDSKPALVSFPLRARYIPGRPHKKSSNEVHTSVSQCRTSLPKC